LIKKKKCSNPKNTKKKGFFAFEERLMRRGFKEKTSDGFLCKDDLLFS
jgi:hypothetical protein